MIHTFQIGSTLAFNFQSQVVFLNGVGKCVFLDMCVCVYVCNKPNSILHTPIKPNFLTLKYLLNLLLKYVGNADNVVWAVGSSCTILASTSIIGAANTFIH
jgi:hypothetical protein